MTRTHPARVAVLTSVHPPFDARVFHREAVTAAAAGFDVTLFAPGAPRGVADGVRMRPVWGGGGRAGRPVRWLQLLIAVGRSHPDIVHVHDPELLPVAVLLQAAGRPSIYDAHEFLAESILSKHWIPAALRPPISRLADRLEKLLSARLEAVITVTPEMAERFRRTQPRTVIVMNLPVLRAASAASRADGAGRRPTAIYAGLMNRERGLTILRSTAAAVRARHPEFELHVLGPVEWHGLETEREAYLRGDWAGSGVVFDPPVAQPLVAERLAEASVGWLPMNPSIASKRLAWPVKLGEYMAAGLPVVASDLPVQAKVIDDAGCGIVVGPFTGDAHGAAIARLLDEPDVARAMGERGRGVALDRLNWQSQAAILVGLYRSIAATRGVRQPGPPAGPSDGQHGRSAGSPGHPGSASPEASAR